MIGRISCRMLRTLVTALGVLLGGIAELGAEPTAEDTAFFERNIRPLLVQHCYACHSEQAQEQQGGLLLDRRTGWLMGGDRDKAVVPGQPQQSLLIRAVRYADEQLQMPPDGKLAEADIRLLEQWVARGAPGPQADLGETEFSRLGNQEFLFSRAAGHWAFQPLEVGDPPAPTFSERRGEIDRFVDARLAAHGLHPSPAADAATLLRRLTYDLTGLPPTPADRDAFIRQSDLDRVAAIDRAVERLLATPAFGEHFGRMWLDVARYADTDSFYRPDTRTPHYFPFAFTYRDYVVASFNEDKPFDQFVREQLAADLMGAQRGDPELAALGFLTVGPHANRNPVEAIDDWIDVTTRGLMGLTVACARCHDHKYEPIPTADYYALQGVFSSVRRVHPLDEKNQPAVPGYQPSDEEIADYQQHRKAIDKKIEQASGKKSRNNNRSVAKKIRETELAQLLLFHPGAPARTMIVTENARPSEPVVFVRGDPANRGDVVPRRFLRVIDAHQTPFSTGNSGRLDLAEKIVQPSNPLTARVFVNRVWGLLMGSYLVGTPSDFGLQGTPPTHPKLLDWLAADFLAHGWSTKRLVRKIVRSRTYQQSCAVRVAAEAVDSNNRLLWRVNRKHLSIEAIRDSTLAVAGRLDLTMRGRPSPLWGEDYSLRRSIYGYINRFNLDPTLRVFDFPTPMQTQAVRGESIVAPQALFAMNAPFVIDQALAITRRTPFVESKTDVERIDALYNIVLQRRPAPEETARIAKFVKQHRQLPSQTGGTATAGGQWQLVAQSLLMSNEFQYVD